MSMLHLIVNPRAGHGRAPAFVKEEVIPLVESLGIRYEYHETAGVGDAGVIGQSILQSTPEGETITVLIAGGDGTAHELIEGVLASTHGKEGALPGRWELIILPLGTANALHATLFPEADKVDALLGDLTVAKLPDDPAKKHSLVSLYLALSKSRKPALLPITLTSILDAQGHPVPQHTPASDAVSVSTSGSGSGEEAPVPSHIVLSTSLHAALLADSEELRDAHPGVERFKIAAEKNLPVAFQADAKLFGKQVEQYDPRSDSFVTPFSAPLDGGKVVLEGPFSYFLSSTTAPRLEPTFVIAPTLSSHPPSGQRQTLDLVVLRPDRSAAVTNAEGEQAKAKARAGLSAQVLGYGYKDGAHVKLTYAPDGSGNLVEDEQRQPTTTETITDDVVVEVYRAEDFEWTPTVSLLSNQGRTDIQNADHAPSHLVCADGSIHTIPKGGSASVSVLQTQDSAQDQGFFVWG